MSNLSSLKETIEEKMPMEQQIGLLQNMSGNNVTLRMYFEQIFNKDFEKVLLELGQLKLLEKLRVTKPKYLSMMDSMTNAGTLLIPISFFE